MDLHHCTRKPFMKGHKSNLNYVQPETEFSQSLFRGLTFSSNRPYKHLSYLSFLQPWLGIMVNRKQKIIVTNESR